MVLQNKIKKNNAYISAFFVLTVSVILFCLRLGGAAGGPSSDQWAAVAPPGRFTPPPHWPL